jgi:hypothetical protein
MATGYTRNDTTNNIANGNVINAADLDGEFDAIQAAYDVTTGHDHDGTVGGGAPIKALGPAQDIVITTSVIRPKTDNTVDLGTSTLEFKDLFLDGTAKVDTLTVDESATIAANLTVDTTTLVVDATNNRVGVGTASPSTTLHISSATPIITLTDTDNPHSATINTNSATGSLSISADTGNAVADSAIILNIDNTEKVRVLADGSVGIGTATPSATLDVVGGAEINGDLTVTGNTTLGNAATDTVTITADVASNLIPSADNTYDLGASGSEWKDLYIDGTANIDALVADAATIITSTGGVLTLQRDDSAITSGETLGEIDFQAPNVSGGGDAIVVAATIKAVAGDTFDAAVNKTSLLFQTASSGAVATRMEIDGDGDVAVDTDTLFVDAVNDRVGINNASPSVALDVTGAATISGILTASSDVSIADKIIHTGDTNTAIRFPAADTVTVETAGTERLRVDSAGNVGIGTTAPGANLDVAATTGSVIRLTSTSTAVSADDPIGLLQFYGSDASAPGAGVKSKIAAYAALGSGDGSYLTLSTSDGVTNDIERMRIDSSGNVGIGTTSPAVKLEVSGDIISVVNGTSSVAARSGDNTNYSQLRFRQTATESRIESFAAGTGTFAPLTFNVNSAERMRITTAGNVGIGTASPGAILELNAGTNTDIRINTSASGYLQVGQFANGAFIGTSSTDATAGILRFGTGATERARIDTSGNLLVGGTSNPYAVGGRGIVQSNGTTTAMFGLAVNSVAAGYWISNGSQMTFGAPSGHPILFDINGERLRIDASGNLGLGVTPSAWTNGKAFEIASAGFGVWQGFGNTYLNANNYHNSGDKFGGTGYAVRYTQVPSSGQHQWSVSTASGTAGNAITFTQAMTLDASGNLTVAKATADIATVGHTLYAVGAAAHTASGVECLYINRLANDGTLVQFRQADTTEGTISVSGTTVSYNGGHLSRWAQFPDNSRPELLKGTVMSNLDQMSNWDNEDNEQLNCVQVSAVEGDANVAGVFVAWDTTDDDYNDILLAMTGDMVIRIAGGTTVQRGDLLMSAGDGTAKPQGDDIVRSKTIAKVTSTHVSHTYADGSYAVPCVLMAC